MRRSKPRRPPFRATYKGTDVFACYVPQGEVSYAPELLYMKAARWALVPWHEFKALDPLTQAEIVAGYTTDNRIEAVQAFHRRTG